MIEIQKEWLVGEVFAGVTCQKVTKAPNGLAIERSFQRISRAQEPNAVLHTTEGHWGPSLNVFTVTGTPTFMVGWNTVTTDNKKASGPLRLGQLCPIGEMALTLKNASGGTETNREAAVQIELIGFSKFDPWLPSPEVEAVLAALMKRLWEVAGIPLQRAGNGSRSVALWDGKAGWFGHGEVPENDHTDPRAYRWDHTFALATPDMKTVWQARSGGKTIKQLASYARMLEWMSGAGVDKVKAAEKENGNVSLRKIKVPA